MKAIFDSQNENAVCTTLITPYEKNVFGDKVGIMIDSDNVNIINVSNYDQFSGYNHDFKFFVNSRFGSSSGLYKMERYREFERNIFMKELNISENEYGVLFKNIMDKKYLSQIQNVKINDKLLKKEAIISAYKTIEKEIFKLSAYRINEINVYQPKVKGAILIGNDISEIPEETLKFVRENNLPIFIMGNA